MSDLMVIEPIASKTHCETGRQIYGMLDEAHSLSDTLDLDFPLPENRSPQSVDEMVESLHSSNSGYLLYDSPSLQSFTVDSNLAAQQWLQ